MSPVEFAASAPGKVNLHLGVGALQESGYHDLLTVFQAVERREVVHIAVDSQAPVARRGSIVRGMTTRFHVAAPAEDIDRPSNLAWRAVDAVVDRARRVDPDIVLPQVRLAVDKSVFVAGGMAGGSADAAAALVAANALIAHAGGEKLGRDVLFELAARLGADVPFCLLGGTAVGAGRGDELVSVPTAGDAWWVLVNPRVPLSTGEVFARLDELRGAGAGNEPHLDSRDVETALQSDDLEALGRALHNDLEPVALAMRPEIREVFAAVAEAGARAIVSGSGPTVAVLRAGESGAQSLAERLRARFPTFEVLTACGPAEGAALL
ncbi:4-diphosphocytidyl-2-C-methyl-D-erythritol kinase [Corynebacterium capitovis DSM 44611]|uniref:4-(cytidine 5'-diphospho)-2-C-methyl-D-erythritol kinase n=1 Tax=Corynebacterium capitovis TaxID=131081 RepID=UPI00036B023F|nr:4-(cytidine 5'-diphospho)-2-C-methyl-D-erythritol kinase [Corynebacterium capitovis]WKD58015.1 4-diphosphocytidyl-2-C-methyl-D-erythritol kinase [Corynebacterium capitovis DSM 44611]